MTDPYEHIVDSLLEAIRTHLTHQYEHDPTDAEVAAYIRRATPADIYQDLQRYPDWHTTARQLKGAGRADTSHVLYVMLWGRVNDWPTPDRSPDEDSSKPQPGAPQPTE